MWAADASRGLQRLPRCRCCWYKCCSMARLVDCKPTRSRMLRLPPNPAGRKQSAPPATSINATGRSSGLATSRLHMRARGVAHTQVSRFASAPARVQRQKRQAPLPAMRSPHPQQHTG